MVKVGGRKGVCQVTRDSIAHRARRVVRQFDHAVLSCVTRVTNLETLIVVSIGSDGAIENPRRTSRGRVGD